jgi:hypothetical protein
MGTRSSNPTRKEVYRDAFFSMKLMCTGLPCFMAASSKSKTSPSFRWLLRVQEIDFAGKVAISAGDEFLQARPKKASKAVQER